MDDESHKATDNLPAPVSHTGHDQHCFIVMPFGRDAAEQKWFRGWYEVVIRPAVSDAGFEPKLAAAEEQPGAINDEIRSHLALDPMVVVDLGGVEPEEDPNPNVMYELGIRHALGLPLVMMAWKGQRLPFDVSNQRIIMEDRELVDLEQNRKRLVNFIHAAKQGKYYRPMDAVGRLATIRAATEALGEDSLMRALAQEVRDLRSSISQVLLTRESRPVRESSPTVKKLIRGKVFRKDLYAHYLESGGDASSWGRLLRMRVAPEDVDEMQQWGGAEWKRFVVEERSAAEAERRVVPPRPLDEEVISAVADLLPPQPWPTGVHREIATKLGVSNNLVSRAIAEIGRRNAPDAETSEAAGGEPAGGETAG